MKRLLLLALCALLSLNADARTLYVDAKRPNNNGNGLSKAKAKKTIQAAINVAKKGDTILVYPGTYAPIKTNNKKIEIKSVKGRKKTKLVLGKTDEIAADLSKYVKKHNSKYNYAAPYCYVWSSGTTDSYKTWPGDAMTSLGNNIYSFTCPAEYNCCVFSDNGNNQTGDLKDIPYNSAIYVKDSGWSEYSG